MELARIEQPTTYSDIIQEMSYHSQRSNLKYIVNTDTVDASENTSWAYKFGMAIEVG